MKELGTDAKFFDGSSAQITLQLKQYQRVILVQVQTQQNFHLKLVQVLKVSEGDLLLRQNFHYHLW